MAAVGLSLVGSLLPTAAAGHVGDGGDHAPLLDDRLAHQHGSAGGHLPPTKKNVTVVGTLDLFAGAEQPGRIGDVAAFGNHAYLAAFGEPDCDTDGGVFVIDIADPTAPRRAGFIPTTPGSYVGEGVQVLDMKTPAFEGQVLIHNNESCVWASPEVPTGFGGMSLWDVTEPTDPKPLAQHVGDPGPTGVAHMIHSAFGWQDGNRAYAVLVDDEEQEDLDIMEITDPTNPVLVSETDLDDETTQPPPQPQDDDEALGVRLHDMVVKQVDGKMLMLASYWDGGYAVLDVDDPARPEFLRDTDFAATEPFADVLGLPEWVRPEGNAHQAEFSSDDRFFLAADENFGPLLLTATITSGPFTGHGSLAGQSDVDPAIDRDSPLGGPTTFIGRACSPGVTPAASPDHIALIERGTVLGVPGTCNFQVKTKIAKVAGYRGAVIFNDPANCERGPVRSGWADAGAFPAVNVLRSTGLKLLGDAPADPCTASTPPVGTASADVRAAMVHDGWGYLHLFDAQTMEDLDQYAIPESLDIGHAEGSGILSAHEVAMDPRRNLAYVAYYSGGFRVLAFGEGGIREVGAFIAEGGNQFWGVEHHRLPDRRSRPLILASDRDSGLWIFRYERRRG